MRVRVRVRVRVGLGKGSPKRRSEHRVAFAGPVVVAVVAQKLRAGRDRADHLPVPEREGLSFIPDPRAPRPRVS